jgi:hypothetical protein
MWQNVRVPPSEGCVSACARDGVRLCAAPVPLEPGNPRPAPRLRPRERPDADPYGHSAAWLARVCQVDASTARKWKRAGRIPPRYLPLLTLADGADLGALASPWRGWKLLGDRLVSPEGVKFSPGEVRAIPYRQALVATLTRQVEQMFRAAPKLKKSREIVIRVTLEPEAREGDTVSAEACLAG